MDILKNNPIYHAKYWTVDYGYKLTKAYLEIPDIQGNPALILLIQNGLDTRIPVKGHDEIVLLGSEFNNLMNELTQRSSLQNLVMNIVNFFLLC